MDQVELLQHRLDKAKEALRQAKRREKEKEEKRIFDLVRRSGLTLAEVEKLLASAGKKTAGASQ